MLFESLSFFMGRIFINKTQFGFSLQLLVKSFLDCTYNSSWTCSVTILIIWNWEYRYLSFCCFCWMFSELFKDIGSLGLANKSFLEIILRALNILYWIQFFSKLSKLYMLFLVDYCYHFNIMQVWHLSYHTCLEVLTFCQYSWLNLSVNFEVMSEI